MALHVGDQMLIVPSALFVDAPFKITIRGIAHGGLIIGVHHVPPQHHAIVAQFLFLLVWAPVL